MSKSDGRGGIEVCVLPLKQFVFGDVDDDIQIARAAALRSAFAFAADFQPRAGFNARRNFYFNCFLFFDTPCAATFLARRFDNLPFAAAVRASSHY